MMRRRGGRDEERANEFYPEVIKREREGERERERLPGGQLLLHCCIRPRR